MRVEEGKQQRALRNKRLSTFMCTSRRHFYRALNALPLATILIFHCIGCGPSRTPYPESLNSQRVEERILAAKHAAEIGDRDVIGILVDRLEDDDEAVRMFAILALEKLTGKRNGYDYSDHPAQRARAVERWRRDVAQQNIPSNPVAGGDE